MATVSFRIQGMTCGGCVRRVRALLQQAGITSIHSVDIGTAQVSLSDGVSSEAIGAVLEQAGYKVEIENGPDSRE